MGKIKLPRANPKLDMTPMVDLGFLLVTFFMLATQFKADEPVVVDTPASTSEIQIPDKDIITLLVGADGKIYFNMDNQKKRYDFITTLSTDRNLNLDEAEKIYFSNLASFGAPFNQVKKFLNPKAKAEGEELVQPGIPADSANNELDVWLKYARAQNPAARIAIKGDKGVKYSDVKQIIKTLTKNRANRFNFITNLEDEKA
jgi:biopolymer transport protein ExbD